MNAFFRLLPVICSATALAQSPDLKPDFSSSEREMFCWATAPDAQPVTALLDLPLTAVHIARAANDVFYLTGSRVIDGKPQPSGEVVLWKSSTPEGPWEALRTLKLDLPVLSAKIHCHDGTLRMAAGTADAGTWLIEFTQGDLATADYESVQITTEGSDPSLFCDPADGGFWWVMDSGRIARMKSRPLDGLAEEPRQIQTPDLGRRVSQEAVMPVGQRGAFLTHIDGVYVLFAADSPIQHGLGRAGISGGADDTYVATALRLEGPWSPRHLAFPHAGSASVFQDGKDQWWSTFNGTDRGAILKHRAAVFPVEIKSIDPTPTYREGLMVRPKAGRHFASDPVYRVQPARIDVAPGVAKDTFRDPFVVWSTDDQCYYLTCTHILRGIGLWRSEDLKSWKFVKEVFRLDDYPADHWVNRKLDKPGVIKALILWAPEIHLLPGGPFLTFTCAHSFTNGIARSKSGRIEGPYELTTPDQPLADWIDSTLHRMDSGETWLIWQGDMMAKLKPDFSGIDGKIFRARDADGRKVGFEGLQIVKIGDWFVLHAAEWFGGTDAQATYDMTYMVSKSITGPWTKRRVLVPHGGHGHLFADQNGKWQAVFFGNDRTAPFRKFPGVVEIEITDTGDDLLLRTKAP